MRNLKIGISMCVVVFLCIIFISCGDDKKDKKTESNDACSPLKSLFSPLENHPEAESLGKVSYFDIYYSQNVEDSDDDEEDDESGSDMEDYFTKNNIMLYPNYNFSKPLQDQLMDRCKQEVVRRSTEGVKDQSGIVGFGFRTKEDDSSSCIWDTYTCVARTYGEINVTPENLNLETFKINDQNVLLAPFVLSFSTKPVNFKFSEFIKEECKSGLSLEKDSEGVYLVFPQPISKCLQLPAGMAINIRHQQGRSVFTNVLLSDIYLTKEEGTKFIVYSITPSPSTDSPDEKRINPSSINELLELRFQVVDLLDISG